MVPDTSGPACNPLRGSPFVESSGRSGHVDLDYRLVRSDIWRSGNHFWLPPAQSADIACGLINGTPLPTFALAREPAGSREGLFCTVIGGLLCHRSFFRDRIRQRRFVEENAS